MTNHGMCSLKYVRNEIFKKAAPREHPPAQNRYMQEKILGELIFARIHAGPVFALARIQENILRNHFPHICRLLGGIHLGANTCRACIRTPANTGKYFWRIIYVLVSCQGLSFGAGYLADVQADILVDVRTLGSKISVSPSKSWKTTVHQGRVNHEVHIVN